MTQDEFIRKIIHKPWVNRSVSWSAVDCYGLVIMYYRHVLGIEIPTVQGFVDGEHISQCWSDENWIEVERPFNGGLAITCYSGDKPAHVGILISNNKVIHSRGSNERGGKVEIHSASALKKFYGRITYHKFTG